MKQTRVIIKFFSVTLSILLLQQIFSSSVLAETIFLKSGKTIEARVVNEDHESITVLDKKGYILTYKKDDIEEIASEETQGDLSEEMNLVPVDKIEDTAKSKSKEEVHKKAEELFKKAMKQYEEVMQKNKQ